MKLTRKSLKLSTTSKQSIALKLNRNNLLKSIKEQAEKDLAQYRIDKEAEYQRDYERVSISYSIIPMLLIMQNLNSNIAKAEN